MKRSHSSRKNFVADFETTTDPKDCRVWAWGLCDVSKVESTEYVDHEMPIGIDIASFLDVCSSENANIYFHNLAFDGSFIVDYLLRNGYKHVKDDPKANEFATLISKLGMWYSIRVKWDNGTISEFRDSYKKIPLRVEEIPKSYGLKETKLDLDYDDNASRPIGHELTEEEIRYLKADIVIVAKVIALQLEQGMTKLTVGSDSLYEYKKIVGNKMFAKLFPTFNLSMDAEVRQAYRGGFTYAADKYKGRIVGPVRVYDVNSLYPSVMRFCPLPYSLPQFYPAGPVKNPEYPLWISSITFTAKLKKDHIPCIQVRNSSRFVMTEYVKVIKEPVTLTCTNVDFDLWQSQYDINIISFNGTWQFKAKMGMFDEYIDKWMAVKAVSTGGLRQIAKLHLNSLYGKFATNPNVTPKIPVLEEDNIVHLRADAEKMRKPVYTPVGVFITAWARDKTIRAAQENYDIFAYADTDSLHLITDHDPDNLEIHPTELGKWANEANFKEGIFKRAKQYTELDYDGIYHTHIAGLPKDAQRYVKFDDYFEGREFDNKLVPQRVPGGIVLRKTTFTLDIM